MRVVATARGYDGAAIREVGEEFDMPDDAGSSEWFVPAAAADEPKTERKSKKD